MKFYFCRIIAIYLLISPDSFRVAMHTCSLNLLYQCIIAIGYTIPIWRENFIKVYPCKVKVKLNPELWQPWTAALILPLWWMNQLLHCGQVSLITQHSKYNSLILVLMYVIHISSAPRWSPSWWAAFDSSSGSGYSVLHHHTVWHCFCHCLPCFQHHLPEQKVIIIIYVEINTLLLYLLLWYWSAGLWDCPAQSWTTWSLQELLYCTLLSILLFIPTMEAIHSHLKLYVM